MLLHHILPSPWPGERPGRNQQHPIDHLVSGRSHLFQTKQIHRRQTIRFLITGPMSCHSLLRTFLRSSQPERRALLIFPRMTPLTEVMKKSPIKVRPLPALPFPQPASLWVEMGPLRTLQDGVLEPEAMVARGAPGQILISFVTPSSIILGKTD